jgi:hypothetical protein
MNLNSKRWIWIVTGMNPIAPRTCLCLATLQALLVNKLRSLSSICCRWNVCLDSMGIAHTTLMCIGLSKHALVQIECADNLKICSSQFALAWKREVCLSFSMSTLHEICTNMQVHVLNGKCISEAFYLGFYVLREYQSEATTIADPSYCRNVSRILGFTYGFGGSFMLN